VGGQGFSCGRSRRIALAVEELQLLQQSGHHARAGARVLRLLADHSPGGPILRNGWRAGVHQAR
jgi:hypothetical protein